jgi:hypothetical protein
LYIDDQVWGFLHAQARSEKTTVSELVRRAVRERYFGNREERMKAMQAFVGIRSSRSQESTVDEEVRKLRRGSRLDRLSK